MLATTGLKRSLNGVQSCSEVSEGVADSFAPGQGHEPAGEWVGGPHDGMGPECLAERAANAPPSGSNHKKIMVSLKSHAIQLVDLMTS